MEEYQFNEDRKISGEPSPELKIAMGQMWVALNKFLDSYNNMIADRGKMNEDTTSLLVVQDALRKKYDELDSNYSDLLQANDDLKRELQELTDATQTMTEKDEKISYFEQKIRELEDNNSYLVSLVSSLEKQKDDFKFAQQDIANKNHELHKRSEDIQKLQNTIAELESKVIELNNFRKELGILSDGKFDQEGVIAHLKENLDKVYLDLQIEKSSAKEQEQRFLDELAKYKQIWKAQETTLEDYSKQLIDKNRLLTEYEKQTETLGKDKQNLISENTLLSNEVKRHLIEIEKLRVIQNEIAIKDKKIEDQEELLFQKDTEIENLSEKIKNLELEINQKSDIDASNYRKMKIDLDNKDILVSNLSNRMKYLNESIQAYEESIKELTGKVSLLENENQSLINEYQSVTSSKIDELTQNLLQKDKILDEFSITLMSAESKSAQIETELGKQKHEFENKLDDLLCIIKQKDKLLKDYIEEIQSKNLLYVNTHDENYALRVINDKLEKELENFANRLNKQKASVNSELENLIKDKDSLISKFERELDELKELKFSNYNTIQKLQEEIADIRAKHNEISSIYEVIYKEVLDLRDERSDYDTNIDELEQKIYLLEAQLEFKSREIEDMNEEYSHYNKIKEDLSHKNKLVADYSSHIKYLNNLNLQYFNTIKDNNNRILELEQLIGNKEKEPVESLIATPDKENSEKNNKFEVYFKDYSDVLNELLLEIVEKNSKLSDYQSVDMNFGLIIKSKDDIIKSLGDKLRNSEVQLMRKDEIINENYNQIKDLNNVRISNKEIIIDLQQSISRLEREIELKEEEINTNQHNLNIIDNLKLQVEAKNQILNDYSEQIMGLQELSSKYQHEINLFKERIAQKEKEISDKVNLIEILKEEITELNNKEAHFESKISLQTAELENNGQEISGQKAISIETEQTDGLTEKLNNTSSENLMLRNNIEDLKNNLVSAKEYAVSLEKKKFILETELTNLKNEFEDLNAVQLRLEQNLKSRDEVVEALEVKISQLEHSKSKSDLRRIILIDKLEKYMEKLEKVININN